MIMLRQRVNFVCLLPLSFFAIVVFAQKAAAAAAAASVPNKQQKQKRQYETPIWKMKRRTMNRVIRSCRLDLRLHVAKKASRAANHNGDNRRGASTGTSINAPTGTKWTFQRPTIDKVSQWFPGPTWNPAQDNSNPSLLTHQFNHDNVGMTDPCVQLGSNYKNNQSFKNLDKKSLQDATSNNDNVILASSSSSSSSSSSLSTTSTPVDQSWWPSFRAPSRKWRVLTYRRRIGQGSACYQRARDAALDWEFQKQQRHSEKGMLLIRPNNSHDTVMQSNKNKQQQQQQNSNTISRIYVRRPYDAIPNIPFEQQQQQDFTNNNNKYKVGGNNVRELWSGPGGRRFVTFTGSNIFFGLSKMFFVNPVMVVYDLMDQRGPDTTFTSTAYATMKGHLLRGEERVTVALRDNGSVDVEIVSISQPGPSIPSKLAWPFVGKMQHLFFQDQLDALEECATLADMNNNYNNGNDNNNNNINNRQSLQFNNNHKKHNNNNSYGNKQQQKKLFVPSFSSQTTILVGDVVPDLNNNIDNNKFQVLL